MNSSELRDNRAGILLDRTTDRMVDYELPIIREDRVRYDGDTIVGSDSIEYGDVMFFGDFHIGHEGFSVNSFNVHLKLLKDNPHIKVVLMGDYIEYAANSGYISDENFNIDEQIDYFIKVLRFLGNERIIAILYGNHDERMIKYTDSKRFLRGWAAEAGLDLDKVHVGEPQRGVTINLKVGDIVYTVYCIHGSTGATINKTSQLKRMATSRMASLLAHGHTHQILWEDKLNKVPTVGGEETRLQHWLVTGSFLKNASYGEKKSYPPSLVGAPIVRFRSDINDMNMWQLPYRSRYLDGGISSPLADIEGMTETFRDSLKVTSKVTTKPKKSKLTREQIREQYDSVIDFLKKRNT